MGHKCWTGSDQWFMECSSLSDKGKYQLLQKKIQETSCCKVTDTEQLTEEFLLVLISE